MSERHIPTPSNLCEVRTYVDKDVGTIVEVIPRNPMLSRQYVGRVNVVLPSGPQSVEFSLSGTSRDEAIASWAERLGAVLDDIETQSVRQRLLAPAASMARG